MQSNDSFVHPNDVPRSVNVNAPGYRASAWLENTKRANSSSKRWAIIIGLIIVALIAGGVTAGVLVTRNKDNDSDKKTSTSSGTSNNSGQTSGVVNSDPNDPSVFDKNPALHQSFWGMCYTPLNVQYPGCGGSQPNVTEDIQILSQLTTRLRTYGSDCNQTEMILEAIQVTKVNMTVFLGIWIDSPVNETTYARQVNQTFDALEKYGTDHVSGLIVGNEYILMEDPDVDNTAKRTAATTLVVERMADVRNQVKAKGYNLPVGTADAGAEITTDLANGADFIMANIHAYFAGVTVAEAADWVWSYYEDPDVLAVEKANPAPTLYIAETGWPSAASEANNTGIGGAMYGVPQLQTFLDTYPCEANNNGTGWFYFEAFDEPWKEVQYQGVEGFWGLFDSNKNLKNITLPNCPSS
ncbi:glycoside hydrolase family 17 protein [Atractiella rhizophila]|nr:glycoside hydrolase family 17 protein [Atractiella rhizophila]